MSLILKSYTEQISISIQNAKLSIYVFKINIKYYKWFLNWIAVEAAWFLNCILLLTKGC